MGDEFCEPVVGTASAVPFRFILIHAPHMRACEGRDFALLAVYGGEVKMSLVIFTCQKSFIFRRILVFDFLY